MNRHSSNSLDVGSGRRGFTLIELLVVVGIIAVLGGMTALSYRAIAKDAKLATGKNAVMAVLDQARSLAIKNNRIVMVVFRPRLDGPMKQYVEATFAQWSGESYRAVVTGRGIQIVDRFVPIPNVAARALPAGVKVGAPNYGGGLDSQWITLSHLPTVISEAPGVSIAVMFAADGTTISMNAAMDAARAFVDYDNDFRQDLYPNIEIDYRAATPPTIALAAFNGGYFEQRLEHEEPFVAIAPYLCVFDVDHVREIYDTNTWTSFNTRTADYTAYLTQNADRLHFSRYTGVVMK
jgi:prepilin-type N-terminal cleavage/methylation domain-containing protein